MSSTLITQKMLRVEELGVVDYLPAWELQKEIQEKVINNVETNTLLLLQHPSVYTAGRRTEISDRPLDNTPVIDVDRGGKITWHGLGQIIGYPILKLKNSTDVVGFVRELETALIRYVMSLELKRSVTANEVAYGFGMRRVTAKLQQLAYELQKV